MMSHPTDISDLAANATLVWDITNGAGAAASRLAGVVRSAANAHGMDAVRVACGELASDGEAWRPPLANLPYHPNQGVRACISAIAAYATGMLTTSGVDAMRAALAFWATERDPARWQIVANMPHDKASSR